LNVTNDPLGVLGDALHALGSLLAAAGAEEHLVVVGGVAMNLRGFSARATSDVDVIARSSGRPIDGAAPDIAPPEPLPEPLASAVRRVARDFGLEEDWLNTDVARQWHPSAGMPPGLTEDIEWHHFGALHIGVPGRLPMIMLKLFATLDQGPRSVHAQDLIRLRPSDEALEHARAWVATQDASEEIHAHLDQAVEHVRQQRDRAR
jgi:hypothetical protein